MGPRTRKRIEAMINGQVSKVDNSMLIREAARLIVEEARWKAKWPMRWGASFMRTSGCRPLDHPGTPPRRS